MKNNKSKPLVVIQCYEDRQQTLPIRKINHTASDVASNNHSQPRREATDNPPPPPPMPVTNGHHNGEVKDKDVEKSNENSIAKSYHVDLNTKVSNLRKNGTLTRTPTPDYNNKIENLTKAKLNEENVDLESLESFKLKNPSNVLPKPPPTYFVRAPNGTATMKKHGRPVSVTIGEYASHGAARREPTKLDFLGADKPDGRRADDDDGSISNRLQSELVMTLSRSNLRKKTEALADAGR